jgi:hypothetical protein
LVTLGFGEGLGEERPEDGRELESSSPTRAATPPATAAPAIPFNTVRRLTDPVSELMDSLEDW